MAFNRILDFSNGLDVYLGFFFFIPHPLNAIFSQPSFPIPPPAPNTQLPDTVIRAPPHTKLPNTAIPAGKIKKVAPLLNTVSF